MKKLEKKQEKESPDDGPTESKKNEMEVEE